MPYICRDDILPRWEFKFFISLAYLFEEDDFFLLKRKTILFGESGVFFFEIVVEGIYFCEDITDGVFHSDVLVPISDDDFRMSENSVSECVSFFEFLDDLA